MKTLLAAFFWIAVLAVALSSRADIVPKGFVVPDCTLSPDGKYGVTVPVLFAFPDAANPKNSVIELKSGKIVAPIKAKWTGWSAHNHGGILPSQWSPDGSLLLWQVDGKWFRDAVVLLKFNNGRVEWQRDLTRVVQQEILDRTKRAVPEEYAKAKKAVAGGGSAYPEGFTIEVAALDPLALPLQVRAALTSNPKALGGNFPNLESELTGAIDESGNLNVTSFQLKKGAYDQLEEDVPRPDVCERDLDAEAKARGGR